MLVVGERWAGLRLALGKRLDEIFVWHDNTLVFRRTIDYDIRRTVVSDSDVM